MLWTTISALAAQPLSQAWLTESDQGGASFGTAVATCDLNGDGIDDLVVSAPGYSTSVSLSDEGRISAYLGGSTRLGTNETWYAESDQSFPQYGEAMDCAGDVNGDGYDDVIVGAYNYDAGATDEGKAFLYLGSAAATPSAAVWSVEGNTAEANLGDVVGSAGDVNGDGYDDVLVGGASVLRLYLGAAGGLSTTAAWTVSLGAAEVASGDVNGDGYDDVIVGAGTVFLYLGSASGLATTSSWSTPLGVGGAAVSAGDVNGDGYDDIVIGNSSGGFVYAGEAYLYYGGASGPGSNPDWTGVSENQQFYYGTAVLAAGDVDGDGYGDVVVGAPRGGQSTEGKVYLYLGSSSGLADDFVWDAESNSGGALLGSALAGGDYDSDGYADVAAAAPAHDNGSIQSAGEVFVFGGSCFDASDGDGDGIGDRCDVCAGGDDAVDTDNDGVPDDCDVCDTTDDPAQLDGDGDGFGDACDCGPEDATVYDGAPELCDGLDNACAGEVPRDERDDDGDGFRRCDDDCDDDAADVFPGADEVCDGVDNSCAGLSSDEVDGDGDGVLICDGDCDEPGASETCEVADTGCGCGHAGPSPTGAIGALALTALLLRRRAR